jgi:phosphomannomutase
MEIFKAYDIRGIYPSELNEETAYKIGRAFVVLLKCRNVVIGRDMRKSSEPLFNAVAKGITDQGADVIDIGMATSPQLYFCSGKYRYDAGIMITASHNPAQYNGMKMVAKGVVPVSYDTGIKDIKELVEKGSFPEPSKKGKIKTKNFHEDYKKFVTKGIKKFPLKVVIDTANSMGAKEAEIIQDYCEIVPLFFELDDSFPNHEANPLKYETLKDLQEKVVEEKADLGIAFDGDADRCAFVDEKGQIISSDMITALLAQEFKGKKIGYDLRSSWTVAEEIKKNKGTPVMIRVGHVFIKQMMREQGIVFAGELSGHYYYKDNYFCESSIKTCFLVMDMVSKGKKLSELIQPLKRYFASGEINLEVMDKDAVLSKVEEKYGPEAKEVLHLDGVSVIFDDWWFNLRKSNTEPLIRLNIEAKTKELMENKRDEVLNLVRS